MNINYIYNRMLVLENFNRKKVSKEELEDIISDKNILQVAPDTYVNISNIKEIDFVNSVIVFDNGEVLRSLNKKIFI